MLIVSTAPGCGQSWPQECGAAGHIVHIVSKQRETKAGTRFSSSFFIFHFSFITSGIPARQMMSPTFSGVFLFSGITP